MRGAIRLRDAMPVATGHKREIFLHPQDDSLLIKIMQPDLNMGASPFTGIQRSGSGRPGIYHVFHHEIGEYLCLRASEREYTGAIQKILGFVDTDRGLLAWWSRK